MDARSELDRPPVSLVVPFLGGVGEARSALTALARLCLRPGDEVIVVDNTGAGVVEREAEEAEVEVVDADRERSSYYARNVGAEEAVNDWLLFIDSDCRPAEALLDDYLAAPVAERVGVIAGGVLSAPDQRALLARYARSRGHISETWHTAMDPPAGVTANLMVRRLAWESLGGFHEGIRSGADVEFCWRAQEVGWELVHRPEARVEHVHPERMAPMLRKAARHAAGRVWVNRRRPGTYVRPRLVRPLARSVVGVLAWTLTARFERAIFKLVDGLRQCAEAYGWLAGDNRAARPSVPSAGPPAERRIAVLTDGFPARSETFIHNEILLLREMGWGIRVESSVRPDRYERWAAREIPTSYLEDDPYRDKLRDLAWLVARHPWRCLVDRRQRRRWSGEEHVWRLASIAPATRRLARAGEAHIHVHFAAGAALHGLRLSRLLGVSYSVAAHAYDIFKEPRNLREKLEQAAFVVTACEYNAEHLRRVVSPSARERIHTLVVGVDAEAFRRRTAYPGGRTVVGVGRLVPKKGFAHLIEAVGRLRERRALDRVVICGDGPLRDDLRSRVERLGLDGTVELVEAWGADSVRDLLEACDLFAMPCVIAADGDRDSMPVAVKEALAMEIPVVGSDEVGMPEMVKPAWGRLVPPADPDALAAAIDELLALPASERAAMGARGRAFVREHCDVHRETERLAGLIREVIDGRRGERRYPVRGVKASASGNGSPSGRQ